MRALELLDRRRWLLYLLLVALGGVFFAIRLSHAPDFDVDETLYTFAAQRLSTHNSISWSGEPILVHPPLYFLTVSAWLGLLGDLHTPLVPALHDARYLNVGICTGVALVTASLTRCFLRRSGAARAAAMLTAGTLVLVNPFMLRFGRSVLIDPMAVLLGLLALRVAWRLRDSPAAVFVPTYGVLIGLSVLTKEPAVFLAAAPLLSAVIRRNRREIGRALAAVGVGVFVFAAFVVTCLIQGEGDALYDQQTFNIRRLLGLAQVSGLNRKGVSPTAAFTETFLQYSGGYILLGVGGLALAVALRRLGRSISADRGAATLLGFGITSYVFLFYSIFIGQSNEQLTVYAVPASALLSLCAWQYRPAATAELATSAESRPARGFWTAARRLGVVISLGAGVASWGAYMIATDDTAQVAVEHYISTSLPTCAPVNATGNVFTWASTLRTNPVVDFASGPQAVAQGVHVFLLSPKDTRFYYGESNPELSQFVMSHGRLLYEIDSHTYEEIQVWSVGTVTALPGYTTADCAAPAPAIATDAKTTDFLLLIVGALGVVSTVFGFARGLSIEDGGPGDGPGPAGSSGSGGGGGSGSGDRQTPPEPVERERVGAASSGALSTGASATAVVESAPAGLGLPAGPSAGSAVSDELASARAAVATAAAPATTGGRGGLWLLLATVFAGAGNYLFAVLLTHRLDAGQYSAFAASQTLLLLNGVIGSAGIPWVVSREISLAGDDAAARRTAITFGFWGNLAAGTLIGVVAGGIGAVYADGWVVLELFATSVLLAVGSTGPAVLQGRGRTSFIAGIVATEVLVKLVVGLVAVHVHASADAALLGSLAGVLVLYAGWSPVLGNIGRFAGFRPDAHLWRRAVRLGRLQVAVGVIASTDTVGVAVLPIGHVAAASYQAAAALGRIPTFFSNALSWSAYPHLVQSETARTARAEAMRAYALLSAFGIVVLSTIPGSVLSIIFPDRLTDIGAFLPYAAALGAGYGALNLVSTFAQSRATTKPTGWTLSVAVVLIIAAVAVGRNLNGVRGLALGAAVVCWVAVVAVLAEPMERGALRLIPQPSLLARVAPVVVAGVALPLVAGRATWLTLAAVLGVLSLLAAFPGAVRPTPNLSANAGPPRRRRVATV